LDYNTVSTRFFENLEESAGKTGAKRVHLVAEAKANWNVLDVFSGTMSLTHNDFAEKLLRGTFPQRAGLKAGATVAHLSFYLAEFLGCDPIILVGQDLGFVDGLYYKPGTAIHETWGVELGRFNTLETKEWERIVRSRTILRKIPDIHGHPMYTEEQFFVYLQQFERDFAASRARVIDATEGGARKQGVQLMTLREAIDRFCGAPLQVPSAPWKQWKVDALANLRKTREALLARRVDGLGMKETCERTIPLLKEMLESQADAASMDRLFVQVDRERGRVGNDPVTFEMVCHLNTIGELQRYQADLGVKGAKADSPERQRRQLLRDVDYVGNLKVGAERLVEIVDEALTRIEKQIAALEAGKPWPREVAGS
ncbi:MAG TPA: 6-hydroxymethylpterin diphosphokinase MptE-like protein, partial [Phycisphaerae bacterium]|nr:6-hydroxymethylpterin diphosphokinase MptE-like protein [Phycisphaerae bacterium]